MIWARLHAASGFNGAPAVNSKGHVIGVVRAGQENNGLISSNSVLDFLYRHKIAVDVAS